MKKIQFRFCSVLTAVLLLLGASVRSHGQVEGALGPFRTQTISLKSGWNAIYLEVEPLEAAPDLLFEGTPIEVVASYFRPVSPQQFVESPNEVIVDAKGWNVWYRQDRDDALLTDLYAIQAHGSYLVYTESDYVWQLQGAPSFGAAQWHPNAYSLVGFPLNAAEVPTVENFFSGIGAHANLKVYSMQDGRWNLISEPEATYMEIGEAYWIYSEGASDFKGPLQVNFKAESLGGMIFTANTNAQELILTNVSPYPQQLTLSLEAGASGQIPLAYEVRELNGDEPIGTSSQRIEDGMAIGPVESGASVVLNLEVVRSEVSVPLMTTILVVSSDAGMRVDVPIVSTRPDLEASE